MKYQGLWSRWHRFDNDGVKYIKRFGLNETPHPLIENGYTQWARGTGPLAPDHYENVANALRKFCKGVPKSIEQKQKMREAKLGVPKSEEHKQKMRDTWKRRRTEKYMVLQEQLNKQKMY